MDRLDKIVNYLHSNETETRNKGDQLIQLACNCIKYSDACDNRYHRYWTARELFDGVLTENQIKDVFGEV